MSLSTLLEAAEYLDFLDSNAKLQRQQNQLQQHNGQQSQVTGRKKSLKRSRSIKKNLAAPMSLPTNHGMLGTKGTITQSVPIPVMAVNNHHQTAHSLSSSLTTTGSPSSSSASTALLCPQASNMLSVSSSTAASSLSSSDSSSSCGDVLMGEEYFNNTNVNNNHSFVYDTSKKHSISDNNGNNNQIYHITHQHQQQQQFDLSNSHQVGDDKITKNMQQHSLQSSPVTQFTIHDIGKTLGSSNKAVTRYIAATSSGPQLVTMRSDSSAAIPIESSNSRSGHIIQASIGNGGPVAHYSLNEHHQHQHATTLKGLDGHTYVASTPFTIGDNLNGSPSSVGNAPLIMTRVQPMILNSSGHPAQSIMAFQQATASSPTSSSSSSYSRHRELHKTLEKNRRAHLRHCFELLKSELPSSECVDKKTSHINIIKTAIRYVLALQEQEARIDIELQRLTRIKNELTESLTKLSLDTSQQSPKISMSNLATLAGSASNEAYVRSTKIELPDSTTTTTSTTTTNNPEAPRQLPVAEQQLSFLLSQSKID